MENFNIVLDELMKPLDENIVNILDQDMTKNKKEMTKFGKRHLEIATKWVPSATVYGATAALLGVYMTDWKLVGQWIPFYGGKFSQEK